MTRSTGDNSIELFDVRCIFVFGSLLAPTLPAQFSDVNAFLTLAATQHRYTPEELLGNPRIHQIVTAAKAGRVPVHIVSSTSPPPHRLHIRHFIFALLRQTCRRRTHWRHFPMTQRSSLCYLCSLAGRIEVGLYWNEKLRAWLTGFVALICAPPPSSDYLGFVSDRSLLSWFTSRANQTASLHAFLTNSLSSLNLPSLYLYTSVVAASATKSVLDAMKLMSDEGVSSVAVIEEENGALLSAVSVRDVGRVRIYVTHE